MAGRLSEADISWDDSLKNLGAKKAAKIGCHLARERSALVMHCQQDALDGQVGIQSAANAHQGVEELRHAFKSEVFALNGDEYGICGDQCVKCKEIESGWAVEDDEIVVLAEVGCQVTEVELAVLHGNELDGSTYEVLI